MVTAALIALVLPLAQAPWQSSRCTGREQIVIDPPGMKASWAGAANIADPSCLVWIAGDLTPREACTTLTHELGHLAGMKHSKHWWSVMYPIPATPRRCKRFSAKPVRKEIRRP